MTIKHFLSLQDYSVTELQKIMDFTIELKNSDKKPYLPSKQLAMIFSKPSTRTRVSFEVGINQLGGSAIVLNSNDMQLNRGETIADTARTLSRYVDMIMIRTQNHDDIIEFAEYSSVPVINGLTNFNHPCQIMTDLFTLYEKKGELQQQKVTWIGDGNNMCHSWINAAHKFGFKLTLALHEKYMPNSKILSEINDNVTISYNALEAAQDADLVTTDTWVSMGDKNHDQKIQDFASLQVTDEIMQTAKSDALFMHCLPAHRGDEVTASIIDGKNSVIFDEAENRLHVQKAIMCFVNNIF